MWSFQYKTLMRNLLEMILKNAGYLLMLMFKGHKPFSQRTCFDLTNSLKSITVLFFPSRVNKASLLSGGHLRKPESHKATEAFHLHNFRVILCWNLFQPELREPCFLSDWTFPFSSVQVIPVQISSAPFHLIQLASPRISSLRCQRARIYVQSALPVLANCQQYPLQRETEREREEELVCECVWRAKTQVRCV